MSRTMVNSSETSLLILALYFWMSSGLGGEIARKHSAEELAKNGYKGKSFPQWKYLLPAISAYSRPTSAFFWLPLIGNDIYEQIALAFNHHFTQNEQNSVVGFLKMRQRFSLALRTLFSIGASLLLGIIPCIAVDSYFYGNLVITAWNFLSINIIANKAAR